MTPPKLVLNVLPDRFAIARLNSSDSIPDWAVSGSFFSVSKTSDELSIVSEQSKIPQSVKCEYGWRALQVKGPLDFNLTGILASLASPLAQAGISIFAISTYDTDYVLVKEDNLDKAIATFQAAGHQIL